MSTVPSIEEDLFQIQQVVPGKEHSFGSSCLRNLCSAKISSIIQSTTYPKEEPLFKQKR